MKMMTMMMLIADDAYKGPEILYPLQQGGEGQEIENQESLQKIVYNPHQQQVRSG